ncbi:peptidoglycan D,D-transpeptidase FtsI family protein [Bacillus kwashiorkori]|uniref:peptidoglycan D,D-transpeptidase FtsI family protein n=1 Tax=Bacillus kwashiorkori TaxID=1522318 RepID=UPI0007853CFD|nr:penicillin-binding transpeptidase domain-containing protein [Bacillus kwashiorkori]
MIKKRITLLSISILIIFTGLIFRLAQIQLIDTMHFSSRNINLIEQSIKQRSQEVVIDNGRGKFLDKNYIPLTHETYASLILFPFIKTMDWDSNKVAEIIGVEPYSLHQALNDAQGPVIFGAPKPLRLTDEQVKQINQLQIPGVFAVKKQFPRSDTVAEQLIGFVGENYSLLKERYPDKKLSSDTLIGISGLQKSFDEFLLQEEATKLIYHVDGKGGPLFGIDVKYVDPANPYYPLNIITTIDYQIQKMLENIVDQHNIIKGGLVLLDIERNAILALVSRPKLDKTDPYKNDGAKNYMFSAEIPGSIFKTVVAAASIDHQLNNPSRTFNCSQKINGEKDEIFDHGILNFTDSFAASCNFTFGQLAKELAQKDATILTSYAEKLGLTSQVGWQGEVFHFDNFKQFANEEVGRVFLNNEEQKDLNYAANSGIGQHNVRITPIAAANMMATIARGGDRQLVRSVSSIQYKNGTTMFQFPQVHQKNSISPYTAMKLQQLLREVIVNEKGTGIGLKDLPYAVAGKSGTAQTNQKMDGEELLNKWFIGYFPFEKPKYALAVVNLDVTWNSGSVTPVFRDVVNTLYEIDYKDKHSNQLQ